MKMETSSFDWDVVTGPSPSDNVVELFPTTKLPDVKRPTMSIGERLAVRLGNLVIVAGNKNIPADTLRAQLLKSYYMLSRLKRVDKEEYNKFLVKWEQVEQRLDIPEKGRA